MVCSSANYSSPTLRKDEKGLKENFFFCILSCSLHIVSKFIQRRKIIFFSHNFYFPLKTFSFSHWKNQMFFTRAAEWKFSFTSMTSWTSNRFIFSIQLQFFSLFWNNSWIVAIFSTHRLSSRSVLFCFAFCTGRSKEPYEKVRK